MHELKLRAWDIERKRMHYVLEMRFEDHKYTRVIFKDEHSNSAGDGYDNDWQYVRKTYLMQCTDAKDINGTEIYEGDLLERVHHILRIESLDRFFWMKYDDQMRIDFSQYEIIGNIYENPEMI